MVKSSARFLTLIRHAKSSWDEPQLNDFERPLAARGLKDAPLVAGRNKSLLQSIEHFYCSSATRARLTLDEFVCAASLNDQIVSNSDSLYTFAASDLLDFLGRISDSQFSIALVGHNPALTDLTHRLTECELVNIPTSGFVRIRSTAESWQSIDSASAKLVYFSCPKNYR